MSLEPIGLPSSVLAVCAHPDDESFGLGGVLHYLSDAGSRTSVLCFTRGEASTLGASPELHDVRAAELTAAAGVLGIERVILLDLPDGSLSAVALDELATAVGAAAETVGASMLLVFDEDGVTGHPDHRRATEAALTGTAGVPVLAWNVPRPVGEALNAEFGTTFAGLDEDRVDLRLKVDRAAQHVAIACHTSQSTDNPVLRRRLELLGDTESLRWLRVPENPAGSMRHEVQAAARH
jgi:LmbE family N-acetylglucosaminyl deacetylase